MLLDKTTDPAYDSAVVNRIEERKGELVILTHRCKGCGICVELCPKQVLALEGVPSGTAFRTVKAVRPEDCILCRRCEHSCPDFAIYVIKDKEEDEEKNSVEQD
jgi:2-oxoglutarate ferredoxin oxidoreductase subunit delta